MPTITVAKAFTLTLEPRPLGEGQDPAGRPVTVYQGEPDKIPFSVGRHEVTDEIAEHWYVRAHLAPEGEEVGPQTQPQRIIYRTEEAAAQVVRNQPPPAPTAAPAPDAAPPEVASRSGEVPAGAHYFAGQPQADRPLPGHEPGISFMPPSAPGTSKGGGKKKE